MYYRIEVGPTAQQEICSLPPRIRTLTRRLVRGLSYDPHPARSKGLCKDPYIYRLWIARRWRLIYQVDQSELRLKILRVLPRFENAFKEFGPAMVQLPMQWPDTAEAIESPASAAPGRPTDKS